MNHPDPEGDTVPSNTFVRLLNGTQSEVEEKVLFDVFPKYTTQSLQYAAKLDAEIDVGLKLIELIKPGVPAVAPADTISEARKVCCE